MARSPSASPGLLWTHFGISGPVALNASRHGCVRGSMERRRSHANFRPGARFDDVDADWQRRALESPKSSVQTALSAILPASVAAAILRQLELDGTATLAHFPRNERRRLVQSPRRVPAAGLGLARVYVRRGDRGRRRAHGNRRGDDALASGAVPSASAKSWMSMDALEASISSGPGCPGWSRV